jgi:hypothetical protein
VLVTGSSIPGTLGTLYNSKIYLCPGSCSYYSIAELKVFRGASLSVPVSSNAMEIKTMINTNNFLISYYPFNEYKDYYLYDPIYYFKRDLWFYDHNS